MSMTEHLDAAAVKVDRLAVTARRATTAAIVEAAALLAALAIIFFLALSLQARNAAVDKLGRVGDCRADAYAATFDDVQRLLIVGGNAAKRATADLERRGSLVAQYAACARH